MSEPTLFELSSPGRKGVTFPEPDVPLAELPKDLLRSKLPLPELSEADVTRHYMHLSRLNYSRGWRLLSFGLLHHEVQSQRLMKKLHACRALRSRIPCSQSRPCRATWC